MPTQILKAAKNMDLVAPAPGAAKSSVEEQQEVAPQPNRSVLKAVIRAIFTVVVYVSWYSVIMGTLAGIFYTAALWLLQFTVSLWPSLDPSGSFQAISLRDAFAATQNAAFLIYLSLALVKMLPIVCVFRQTIYSPQRQVIKQITQWWMRATSFLPSIIFSIFNVASLSAVGPVGAMKNNPWLDVRHAIIVAAVVCALRTTFHLICHLCTSKPAARLTEQDIETQEMERGRLDGEAPAKDHHAAITRATIVLLALACISSMSFIMAYAIGAFNSLAHSLLLRIARWPLIAPRDPVQLLGPGAPLTTKWTATLGALAIFTPCLVIWFLPMPFILEEIVVKKSFLPLKLFWTRVAKPVPKQVTVCFLPALYIASGPIGVWLSQYWPSEGGPSLNVSDATKVAVVACMLMLLWEKFVRWIITANPVVDVPEDVRQQDQDQDQDQEEKKEQDSAELGVQV